MDKNKDNKKKPLKLSSTGRLQIRKNLGPSGDKTKSNGNKKLFRLFLEIKITSKKALQHLNQILGGHLHLGQHLIKLIDHQLVK